MFRRLYGDGFMPQVYSVESAEDVESILKSHFKGPVVLDSATALKLRDGLRASEVIVEWCHRNNERGLIILQVNKDGQSAGYMEIPHLVDAVVNITPDPWGVRAFRVNKSRWGPLGATYWGFDKQGASRCPTSRQRTASREPRQLLAAPIPINGAKWSGLLAALSGDENLHPRCASAAVRAPTCPAGSLSRWTCQKGKGSLRSTGSYGSNQRMLGSEKTSVGHQKKKEKSNVTGDQRLEDLIEGMDGKGGITKAIERAIHQGNEEGVRVKIVFRTREQGTPSMAKLSEVRFDPKAAQVPSIKRSIIQTLEDNPGSEFSGQIRIDFQNGDDSSSFSSFQRTIKMGSAAQFEPGNDEQEDGNFAEELLGGGGSGMSGTSRDEIIEHYRGLLVEKDNAIKRQAASTDAAMGFLFKSQANMLAMFDRSTRMMESYTLRFGFPQMQPQVIETGSFNREPAPAAGGGGMGMLPMLLQAAAQFAKGDSPAPAPQPQPEADLPIA